MWQHIAYRGHCGRLAAPAGGRATGRQPPEPDPSANAQVWWRRGSRQTPADHLSPEKDQTRKHQEKRMIRTEIQVKKRKSHSVKNMSH